MSFTTVFRQAVPHGLCVGVRIPADGFSEPDLLAPEERAFAAGLGPGRQATWIGGRLAAHAALAELDIAAGPLLANDRGAPIFPASARGSISHKQSLAVALVAPDEAWTLGVDVEHSKGPTTDVSRRVLSAQEYEGLAAMPPDVRAREVLFRFAAKEALYKALDPHVRRFVGFHEVSIVRDADGSPRFELHLAEGEGPFETELGFWSWQEMLVVTARVKLRAS